MVHLDGYDFGPMPTGQSKIGPRHEIFHFSDDGYLTALRYDDWKSIFMEQKNQGKLRVWIETFVSLRVPVLQSPEGSRRAAASTSNTCPDWLLEHAFMHFP